jgi:hypothetical protein
MRDGGTEEARKGGVVEVPQTVSEQQGTKRIPPPLGYARDVRNDRMRDGGTQDARKGVAVEVPQMVSGQQMTERFLSPSATLGTFGMTTTARPR